MPLFWSCPLISHIFSSVLTSFLFWSLLIFSCLFSFVSSYLILSLLNCFLLMILISVFSSRTQLLFRHITHKLVWAHPPWKNLFLGSVFYESCQKCFHCCQLILSDSWEVWEIISAHMPALHKGVFGVISEICVSWFITEQWWLLFHILVLGKTWN